MSYKVVIDNRAQQAIASWALPRDVLLQVYDHLLVKLSADPDKYLTERIVPLAYYAFPFAVTDPNRLPHRHAFVFAVDRLDDKQELHIMFGRHSTEAPESG